PYTARAVAALAFGVPVGAVDVNVRRVLGRIVAGSADAISTPTLQDIADAAVPPDRPSVWTHALMDVGATICKPRAPRCELCPARPWCRFAAGEGSSAAARGVRGVREAAVPFSSTNRWLRGRILDRLRAAPDGAWVELPGVIGAHEAAAVAAAVRAMADDGVLELAPQRSADEPLHARLPLG
ncbi:MAG: hypothetical protein ABIQ58_10525, partial [Candidatus Limnocylindrales bacterium]